MTDKLTFEQMKMQKRVSKQGSAEFKNKNLVEVRDEKSAMFGQFKLMALKTDNNVRIRLFVFE